MRRGAGEFDVVMATGGVEGEAAARVFAAEIAGIEGGFVDLILVDVAEHASAAKPGDGGARMRTRRLAFQHHLIRSHHQRGGGRGNAAEVRRLRGVD